MAAVTSTTDRTTECRDCGRSIEWARIDGRNVPLDCGARVYVREHDPDYATHERPRNRPFWVEVSRDEARVNHHDVCPARARRSA